MNQLLVDGILLAQQHPLESFAREFQGRQTRLNSEYVIFGLLAVTGILLVVWLLSKVAGRDGGREPADSARALFLSLCRAHRLRWRESWLLWRVARDRQLKDAARLFLEPERLEADGLSPGLQRHAARLEDIARRLFRYGHDDDAQGSGPPEESAPTSPQPPGVEAPAWPALPRVPSESSG